MNRRSFLFATLAAALLPPSEVWPFRKIFIPRPLPLPPDVYPGMTTWTVNSSNLIYAQGVMGQEVWANDHRVLDYFHRELPEILTAPQENWLAGKVRKADEPVR